MLIRLSSTIAAKASAVFTLPPEITIT